MVRTTYENRTSTYTYDEDTALSTWAELVGKTPEEVQRLATLEYLQKRVNVILAEGMLRSKKKK